MTELIPCPFCGSGWLYETRRVGYCDDTPTMFCNSCKAVVTWEQVEEEGVNDETKAFVREHWNTRAELGSGTCEWGLSEKWPNAKGDDYVYGYETECGRRYTWWPDTLPSYCPSCGKKVKVGE